jgi:hypothetical protein
MVVEMSANLGENFGGAENQFKISVGSASVDIKSSADLCVDACLCVTETCRMDFDASEVAYGHIHCFTL